MDRDKYTVFKRLIHPEHLKSLLFAAVSFVRSGKKRILVVIILVYSYG